eukprot:TRINITY_DN1857_c0_g1_i7.p1 TRINITY_DN1857_c0_g1~~TRINITY_DN1857_c0_g1_i7.p1  ORF type:complete len:154 (-),score=30.50 TRINITY_DN1857_c0_g1_i7:106-567(-)
MNNECYEQRKQTCKLSCAEAFAAALYICGLEEDARSVLARFKWGDSFFTLNGKLLEEYQSCRTGQEVIKVQTEWLESFDVDQDDIEQEDNQEYCSRALLPPSDDEEESHYDCQPTQRSKEEFSFLKAEELKDQELYECEPSLETQVQNLSTKN